jgi:ribosome biogenesis GTPase
VADLARIAIDDGIAYVAWTAGGAVSVRLSARMLREVRAGTAPRPVVGDLVTLSSGGIVEALEPRRTRLARRAAGAGDAEQVMAANVDLGFVATAAGADVNERRLERYLAIVRDGGVEPAILLTKADTSEDLAGETARVQRAVGDVRVIAVSSTTGQGVDEVAAMVAPDRLAVLLGSSGVGKSTLVNRLLGSDRQRVAGLRGDGKGRHTTTRRELFALPGGGFLFDTPGLREVGRVGEPAGRRR